MMSYIRKTIKFDVFHLMVALKISLIFLFLSAIFLVSSYKGFDRKTIVKQKRIIKLLFEKIVLFPKVQEIC